MEKIEAMMAELGKRHGQEGLRAIATMMHNLGGDTLITFSDGTYVPCDFIVQMAWANGGEPTDSRRTLGQIEPVEHTILSAKSLPKMPSEQVARGLESPKWRDYVGLAAPTIRDLAADLSLATAERDAADEVSRTSQRYVEAMKPVLAAARTILETFEKDETQGYRSKDRQFAITVLRGAIPNRKDEL